MYYENLITTGFDDLENLVIQMKTPLPLNKDILTIAGITKIGHINRLLMGLEIEAGISDLSGYYSLQNLHTQTKNLLEWLSSLKLENLMVLFVKSGYDDLEMIRKLMFSRYPLTDEILDRELGVHKQGYRYRILGRLHDEIFNKFPSSHIDYKTSCKNCSLSCGIF